MTISTPLYELTRYQSELERLADSGEVPPEEIKDTLEALEGDIKEKAVQVAAMTRNLDASAEAIREAGLAMLARADRLERRADSIRSYLLFHCQVAGITRIESPWFVVRVCKNPPSVVIDDEILIPAELMVTPDPPPKRPNKMAIGAKLKAGEDVPGARLMQTERLEIKE
jgi:Siphovirus Gp157